eukprot:scaffold1564_cov389-Prasinococcus_capsulatus_cf.AAC.15
MDLAPPRTHRMSAAPPRGAWTTCGQRTVVVATCGPDEGVSIASGARGLDGRLRGGARRQLERVRPVRT